MRGFALSVMIGMLGTAGCGGVIDGSDSGTAPADASNDGATKPPPDGGFSDGASSDGSCTGTYCGATCVDTGSDPNNCGACGIVCDSGSCSGGTCASGKQPPSGSCAHSLCEKGAPLQNGCDPTGCTAVICDPTGVGDTYCCATTWDNTCVNEVGQYCAPYSCD